MRHQSRCNQRVALITNYPANSVQCHSAIVRQRAVEVQFSAVFGIDLSSIVVGMSVEVITWLPSAEKHAVVKLGIYVYGHDVSNMNRSGLDSVK